jgi:RNA polymerase sigma-70 factor (ECF subfamily)
MGGDATQAGRWLAAARSGSREALGEALEACRGYLLQIAQRELSPELRPKGGASDLVQQTFLEAQRDFDRFQGDSEDEWRAWLRQLLLHNLANFARGYRDTAKRAIGREVALPEGETPPGGAAGLAGDVPSPSGMAMANEQSEAVRRALERLPETYRQVLLWRHQEGLHFVEIGRRLNRTANAARKLWARAVELFQQECDTPP